LLFAGVLLLLVEMALRLAGVGAPSGRLDPQAGFEGSGPLFVRTRLPGGREVFQTAVDRLGAFNPQSFAVEKPAGTIRFFCIGGSSTFGFPWDASVAYCSDLGKALGAARPEIGVEAINCGGMSYGSGRLARIARELAAYQADAWILYVGDNEYVERRFFAPLRQESAWRRRVREGLGRLRLATLIGTAMESVLHPSAEIDVDPYGVGPVRDDSRREARSQVEDEAVARDFSVALAGIRELAVASGARLLLVRPAANLRGWSPEASDWSATIGPAARARRDVAFAAARTLHESGRESEALEQIDATLRLDDRPAIAYFVRGRILEALGRLAEAREAFRAARDRDAVPIRITSALEERIAQAWSAFSLAPLDAESVLAPASRSGIVGDEMVLDYCHPTIAGHRRIAALLLPALQAELWPTEAPRAFDFETGAQADETLPASPFGAAWGGQMLLRQGRAGEAAPYFARALQLDPSLATAHEGLGRVLAAQGRVEEAIRELTEATRLAPRMAGAWNNLGLLQAASGRHEEAVRSFQKAIPLGVGNALVRGNLSASLLALGRLDEARREAERARAESPTDASIWIRLAEVRARQGDRAGAESAFMQALELDPTASRARSGLEALRSSP
jgi:Flp pilus assembly protein TadD